SRAAQGQERKQDDEKRVSDLLVNVMELDCSYIEGQVRRLRKREDTRNEPRTIK
ncbi:hypothetical protein SK128_003212, partial [Halocaridina rubra]